MVNVPLLPLHPPPPRRYRARSLRPTPARPLPPSLLPARPAAAARDREAAGRRISACYTAAGKRIHKIMRLVNQCV